MKPHPTPWPVIDRPWRDDITADTGRHEHDGSEVDYGMCVDVLVQRHRCTTPH